jgi:hypothetical protein
MNTTTRNSFIRIGAGAGVVALCAALTLGAAAAAQADVDDAASVDVQLETLAAPDALASGGDPSAAPAAAPAPVAPVADAVPEPAALIGVNTPPVAVADAYAVTQDVVLSLADPGVLVNDSDADGHTVAVKGTVQPIGGSLPGEAISMDMDGSFHYVPPIGFTGVRTWFYSATDSFEDSPLVEIVFTITAASVPAINVAPVANADAYLLNVDATISKTAADGFLTNDTDADGDALVLSNAWEPTGGYLPGESLDPKGYGGAFSYTPPTGFTGDRVFTYAISDGTDVSNIATLTFNIYGAAPANSAPVANPDWYLVVTDVPFTRLAPGYLENDTDADGDTLMWSHLDSPTGGLLPGEDLTMKTSSGEFVYTPPTGFTGTREFQYLATDGTVDSNYATLTFTVQPRVALDLPDEPDLPTLNGDDPTDGTVPTALASTGSTTGYALAALAALLAATGFVLVRSSRRVA